MTRTRARAIYYSNAEEGVTPPNCATPWAATTAGSPTVSTADDGWTMGAPTSSDILVYSRQFFAADLPTTSRASDRMEFQIEVTVTTNGAFAGLWLCDGAREMGVNIKSTLTWNTGMVLTYGFGASAKMEIQTNFSASGTHVFHLIKHGSERWELRVDGQTLSSVPYDLADASSGDYPARASFGVIGTGGTAVSARFQMPEASVNMMLPPQWKVDKAFYELHPSVQDRFTSTTRAFLRAIIGEMEHGAATLTDIGAAVTGGRSERAPHYYLKGDVYPTIASPAWTNPGLAGTPLVGERIRIFGTDSGSWSALVADLDDGGLQGTAPVYYCRGRFLISSSVAYTPGTGDLVCHPITIDASLAGLISASIGEIAGASSNTQWGVTIAEGDHSSGLVSISGRFWPIDIYQENEIELVLISGRTASDAEYAILLVNGMVVDFADLSAASSSPSVNLTATISAGQGDSTEGSSWFDVWDVEAGVYGYDPGRRTVFEQLVCEDLIFAGGCETNAVLDAFVRHRWGMMQIRGTQRGILLDLWRMTCQMHNYLIQETTPSAWMLDVAYPDETPIWLDAPGQLSDVYVEFAAWPPNFTLEEFAALLARYVIPMSVVEHQFWICLIAVGTAAISAGSSVNIAVESSGGFTVGDMVTVREFDNSISESAEVTAIPDATHITVDVLANSYTHSASEPPIVRLVIRGT